MLRLRQLCLFSLAILAYLPMLHAQTGQLYTVGQGAPNPEVLFLFQNAWTRNGFSSQAVYPTSM